MTKELKLSAEYVDSLSLLGISGIANLLSSIKFAKYYELTEKDVVCTVLTDPAEMYHSRLREMNAEKGPYSQSRAMADHERFMLGIGTDNMQELTYPIKKRIHNLKYFTWVEQQGRDEKELNAQWYDYDNYWRKMHRQVDEVDALIEEFNKKTGL